MIKKHMWCWFVRITKCFACFQWKNIFCDLSECILLQTFHVLIVNKSNMTIGWICSNFFAWFHQHLSWIVDAIFLIPIILDALNFQHFLNSKCLSCMIWMHWVFDYSNILYFFHVLLFLHVCHVTCFVLFCYIRNASVSTICMIAHLQRSSVILLYLHGLGEMYFHLTWAFGQIKQFLKHLFRFCP